MSRWSPNRHRRLAPPKPRAEFSRAARRVLEVVFWILLLLAAGIGGPGALEGMPKLAALVTPSGVFAAEASTAWRAVKWTPPQIVFGPLAQPETKLETASEPIAAPPIVTATKPIPKALPAIALVIDDMGGEVVQNRRAIALPKEVSLSFLPDPVETPRLAQAAREAGHQILVHVPMEAPRDRDGSLKRALRRDLPLEENLRRLDWALGRVPGYVGINNHEGSVFTADRKALVPVAEALYGRGLFFLDSRTSPLSEVVPVARAFGVPSSDRDIFLDDDQAAPAIARQLNELERVAREQGVAIAIGHPHAATLDLVTRWCAEQKGFRLITASEAIRMKTKLDMGVEMASSEQ